MITSNNCINYFLLIFIRTYIPLYALPDVVNYDNNNFYFFYHNNYKANYNKTKSNFAAFKYKLMKHRVTSLQK